MLYVIFAFAANAQKPIHKIYTHKNGLPSNDVKAISQDNLGYMWFLNGDGITRFDGIEFDYSFLGNHFYDRMYRDHLGRIWLCGSAMFRRVDQLKYCYSGEIHTYAYNHILDSLAAVIQSIVVDEDENVWIGLRKDAKDGGPCLLCISPKGEVDEYYFNLGGQSRSFILRKVGDTYVHATVEYSYQETKSFDLLVVDGMDTVVSSAPRTHEVSPYCHNGRLFFITRHNGILELKGDTLVPVSPQSGLAYPFGYVDIEGRFFIPSTDNGLYQYDSLDFDKEPNLVLREAHFCAVFQSKDGSYWLGTRDKGLYYSPSFDIQMFDQEFGLPNAIITGIQATDSMLWIANRGGLSEIALGRVKLRPKNYDFGGYISGVYMYRDSLMFLGWMYDFAIPENFPYNVFSWRNAMDIKPFSRDQISFASGHSINCWYDSPNSRRSHFLVGDFVKTHLKLGFSHYLYSDMGGVKRYLKQAISPMGLYDTLLKKPVYAIEPIGKKWMLLASEVYGIVAMKDSANVFSFGKPEGLSGNVCKNLCVDTDSTFWVVTENGLDHVQYSLREDTVLFELLGQFGGEYGLSFSDAIHLKVNKKDVWLAFMNLVMRIPRSLYDKMEHPLKPIVQNVYQSGKKVKNLDSVCIPYTIGAADFEIAVPYFSAPEEIRLRYRLEDEEAVWSETEKRTLSLRGISPGKHILSIVAVTRRGVESPAKEFHFQVTPLFWQTHWFKAAGILLILLAGTYYGYKKREQKKNRKRLLGEIKTYKNTALRLQMNPHFVYNSLGSIQSFVLKQESKVSSKYIAKLSRLMRLIFDHNNRELVSLKEELEVLALYVDLEFLRHDQSLTYELTLDPTLSPEDIMIPPMLLQPLVENAILHGLVPQKGLGLISVAIKPSGSGLEFSISDNGTGIRYSHKKGAANTRRSGGVITSDRVALFNQQHHFEGFFKLDEQNSLGTRISFSLPLITLE